MTVRPAETGAEVDANRTGLALIGDISTEIGMALPASTTYEQWEAVGYLLGEMHRRTPWLIGDWYTFGEAAFGTRSEGANLTGVTEDTISTYAWVCRRIAPEERRVDLTFTHHRHVAQLPQEERRQWLDKAVSEDMRAKDLYAAVRAAQIMGAKSDSTNGDVVPATDAAPTYTPKEALTAIRSDETWRSVADEALSATLVCPHCGGEVPLV